MLARRGATAAAVGPGAARRGARGGGGRPHRLGPPPPPQPPWGPGGQGGRGEGGGGGRKTFQKIQRALMHRLDAVVFLSFFACVQEAPEVK